MEIEKNESCLLDLLYRAAFPEAIVTGSRSGQMSFTISPITCPFPPTSPSGSVVAPPLILHWAVRYVPHFRSNSFQICEDSANTADNSNA
jgi:hypothetical protein